MAAFDLVIFDCDGVLVDTEGIGNEVLSEVLAKHGIAIDAIAARDRYEGFAVGDIARGVEVEFGVRLPEDWTEQYYEMLIHALRMQARPIKGVELAIGYLRRQGILCCVASQGPLSKIEASLQSAGLWEAFAGRAYSAKSVLKPKPAPDVYLHVAQALDVQPDRCAVIEDSATGIRAGRTAGMTVFAFCQPDRAHVMASLGAIPFHAMEELPGALASYAGR